MLRPTELQLADQCALERPTIDVCYLSEPSSHECYNTLLYVWPDLLYADDITLVGGSAQAV